MATADEILAAMEEEPQAYAQEEDICVIDQDLRVIALPALLGNLGVESDEAVKRLHFRMPRMYRGVDLSGFALRINFQNAKGEGDVYLVDDMQVDGGNITFSWLLWRSVTKYRGDVQFTVRMIQTDAAGEIIRELNTTVATSRVLTGLEVDVSESEEEEMRDVLAQMTAQIRTEGEKERGSVTEEGNEQIAAVAAEGERVLATIPEDYTEAYNLSVRNRDHKADVIWDTSARAAAHELHAQRGPLAVTLHGRTTETGEGDKSPDNPYVISGVDAALIRAGSKNLANVADQEFSVRLSIELDVPLLPGTYTVSFGSFVSTDTFNEISIVRFVYSESEYVDASFKRSSPVATFTLENPVNRLAIYAAGSAAESNGETATFTKMQIERGAVAIPYEPYIANTADLPLLPDGAPLMGNGTVDDTVENDVLSGCDKRIVFDGSEDEKWYPQTADGLTSFYIQCNSLERVTDYTGRIGSDRLSNTRRAYYGAESGITGYGSPDKFPGENWIYISILGMSDVNELRTWLAANPLTVYYRSTEYTPDKDLRVCRVTRKWIDETLDGTEKYSHAQTVGSDGFYFFRSANKQGISDVSSILCESLKSANEFSASSGGSANIICNANATSAPRFYLTHELLGTNKDMTSAECLKVAKEWIGSNPIHLVRELGTPEVYMTDKRELRKPETLTTDTVTVTGSGETAVSYPHDTKHYIDEKFAALSAALIGG